MLPLIEAERQRLLGYARDVLERSVRGEPAPELYDPSPALQSPTGAFVTLRSHNGKLRGCIGRVLASQPLFQTVAECAVEAARLDPRFSPVRPEELAELRVEISVLSPPENIPPEEIEVGRHGLLISLGWRRGLLLPQVAHEWGWNRERFLDAACLKAGLPRDAWRHGARIQAFTAEVFAEARAPEGVLSSRAVIWPVEPRGT